jgi:pimeloyl-ACP methyl ester carboxylesterase
MDSIFFYKSGRIFYTDTGEGQCVVLIHGYLETSEVWTRFAKRLSSAFRVITFDLPGHGHSDLIEEVTSMELIADILSALIENLGIKKVFVTGHSLGGYATLAFADLYPDKVSGYCLFHSQPFADTRETIDKRMKEISLVSEGKKEQFYPANITRMYANNNLDAFYDSVKLSMKIASTVPGEAIVSVLKGMIARPSRVALMESGKLPCLWILGAQDNYIDHLTIQSRVQLPSNCKVVILEGSGHMGFIEEEITSSGILGLFLKDLEKLT